MMLMCRMAKPFWGSGNKVIMGSIFFVLKVLLVCLRKGSMEVNWPRRMDTGRQKSMYMETIPIVK